MDRHIDRHMDCWIDRCRGARRSLARGAAFLACLAALWAPAGCTTTEMVKDSFQVDVPTGDEYSVLDAKLRLLSERAKEYPRRADLQYKIAAIHFQKEDFRESARHLRKAIYLEPDHVRYHFDLGRVHLQMGEIEEAERAFRKAVEIGGQNRWSGLYAAHGYALCRLKRWDEARSEFEKCISIDPKDPTPYYFLGSIADIGGNVDEAVKYMRLYLEKGGRSFRSRAARILEFHGVKVGDLDVAAADEGKDAPAPAESLDPRDFPGGEDPAGDGDGVHASEKPAGSPAGR